MIPLNLSALLLSNEKIRVEMQMSELVIKYNEKFVKGIYLGDLVYRDMCVDMRRRMEFRTV